MIAALINLGDKRPKATVVIAASIAEEYRKIGAHAIARSVTKYDAAVAGEPTDLELVVDHKGSVHWQMKVERNRLIARSHIWESTRLLAWPKSSSTLTNITLYSRNEFIR